MVYCEQRGEAGCTLSPWLFSVYWYCWRRKQVQSVFFGSDTPQAHYVVMLMSEDDMVMMAKRKEMLQHIVRTKKEAVIRWDLEVNWSKSKVLRVARERSACQVMIVWSSWSKWSNEVPEGMINDHGSMQ